MRLRASTHPGKEALVHDAGKILAEDRWKCVHDGGTLDIWEGDKIYGQEFVREGEQSVLSRAHFLTQSASAWISWIFAQTTLKVWPEQWT